jgi:protein-S-isoprenylcysteine O-methyltransferase Ste14
MRDFNSQLSRSIKISGFLLALLCLMLLLNPRDPVIWGLVIGVATGMVSAFFMGQRANKAVDSDIDVGKIQLMSGVLFRLLFIIGVLFIVYKTGWVNLIATAGGLFIVQGVFILLVIFTKGASEGDFVNDNAKD